MSESAFSGFTITDDDPDAEATDEVIPSDVKPRPSQFTILVDTNEQKPYTFKNITGDSKDDYSPILVRTKPKSLRKLGGDYSILGLESICIERKSKVDLFGSVATGVKRDNFIERLRKMQSLLRYGAVIVECYKQELFDDPPEHTRLNPKTVYRTTLSWAIQFPLVHWHWARDRDEAEQIVYRLLEKHWEHETNTKYKAHNKPIDSAIEAYRLGIIARMTANEIEAVYGRDNPLRLHWLAGWDFYSNHFLSGDRGAIYEHGETPPSEAKEAVSAYKSKKGKNSESKIKPLPNQTSFIDDEVSDMLDNPQKKIKSK